MKKLDYEKALDRLQGLSKFGINLGLQRITALLGQLGDPQEDLCCIHIGGTNGKGSTTAILAAILQEAGYRTGVFTSPHLVSYRERFTVNGVPIAEEDFARCLSGVIDKYELVRQETGEAPTEFEALTALAFLYFAEQKVDFLLLEAGMGGNNDSTNVIRQPLLSIITNVALDHCAYLGNTLQAIAGEKSGIIKQGSPVITASNNESVLEILRQTASARQAPFHEVYREAVWQQIREVSEGQFFSLETPSRKWQELFIPLRGDHQLINAAAALLALEVMEEAGWLISKEAVTQGLARVYWPGRLEKVRENPLVIVDGAHNPDGQQALALWLSKIRPQVRKIYLVIGMLDDKEPDGVRLLEPLADSIIVTRVPSQRALKWDNLAAYFKELGHGDVRLIPNPRDAVDQALAEADKEDLILVTGSLYLIGELRLYLLN